MSRELQHLTDRAIGEGRRAGAPRLIDWTGERFVPWAPDVQVAYEHYHRYVWAEQLVQGRRVLDLASGEGFGSAILASVAESVVGVDLDEAAIEHSRLNYEAPNLEFRVGSALDLSELDEGSFDAVVAFEMIEHVEDHERLLAEIDRVLAEDGLLVMSTPDRRVYSDGHGQDNPYHVHELDEAEFRKALAGRFEFVRLWGQRVATGSRIGALDDVADSSLPIFLERAGDAWRLASEGTPLYLIAVAAHVAHHGGPRESNLMDYGLELMRGMERQAHAAAAELERQRAAAEEHRRAAVSASAQLGAAQEAHAAELDRLTHEVAVSRQEVDAAEAARAETLARLRRYDESITWDLLQKARSELYGRIGRRSVAARALQGSLRAVGRARARRQAPDPQALPPVRPVRFPQFDAPVASLIIPVHAQADLTEACLRSIVANTEAPSYEVVLVDDTADEPTKHVLRAVENATVLVNEHNLGYLRSMNRGVASARGRYVVLFNNDTEVQPGWLEAMVARAESAPDIGAVTPMLVYPDGVLQEAGGIVFENGDAWNYGKGESPDRPEFNYVRDVDYGSGAALMVRKDLFDAVGGYDERFAPIYYEDTDLCFALRERGCRTVYEPAARVIHVEGATSGTDASSGTKRHQALNQPKFVEKWQDQLARQPRKTPKQIRRLSNTREPHVLVIDHRIPTPDQDSGSLRMMHVLQALLDHGCRVTFLPDSLSRHEPYSGQLRGMGVEVLDGRIEVWQELVSFGPHLRLVIASRPYVAARYLHLVREHAPAARLAYDTVDLHFVRERMRGQVGNDQTAIGVASTMRELELGLIRGSDVTLVVTDDERAHVHREVPDARVEVVPNAHEVVTDTPGVDGRDGLLFVGGFEHLPNVDAARYLVRSIMPLVWQQLGDVPLIIAGSKAPREVLELASAAVEVAGYVPDLRPLIDRSRVMVAPLRYGAGMKGKVTQSLALGLPVVTTPIGAEGLAAVDGRDMLIAEEPRAFSDAIVRAYRDDELWRRLSENGQALVERTCSVGAMHERVGALLALAAR